MDEVLLSRPILQSMGFNLQEYLCKFREKFQDTDFSSIGFTKGEPILPSYIPENSLSSLLIRTFENRATESSSQPHNTGYSTLYSLPEPNDANFGTSDRDKVRSDLKEMIKKAIENGFPDAHIQKLTDMIFEYHIYDENIFPIKMGADPPSSVPPMIIKLTKGAKPIRAKVRRYSQPQFKFLKKKISELENLGLLYKNNKSRWASAPVVVPKPKSVEE